VSSTNTYAWVQSFDGTGGTGTAAFEVSFSSDLGTDWNGKSVLMRYKTTDANSGQEKGTVYDEFTVSFNYECLDDELTEASADDINAQSYTFGAASDHDITLVFSQTKTGCALTYKVFGWSALYNDCREFADADTPMPYISATDTSIAG